MTQPLDSQAESLPGAPGAALPPARNSRLLLERALAMLVLASAVVLTIFNVRTFDLFWHLANGREMLLTGQVVCREIFSYTHLNQPFDNHEWLSQVVLYAIYAQGGLLGLAVFKTLIVSLTVAVLYRTVRLFSVPRVLAALLCFTAVAVGLERYLLRPGLFSFCLLVLLQLVVYGIRAGRFSVWGLAAVPPIMVLWDLMQGAIYGLLLLGAFAAGELLKPTLQSRTQAWPGLAPMPKERIRAYWICAAATLITMGLNPYGLITYGSIINIAADPTFGQGILEWLPPELALGFADFWLLLALTLVLLASRGRRLDPTAVLVLCPFVAMALRYRRAAAVFALVVTPLLAQAAAPLLHRLVAALGRSRPGRRWPALVAVAVLAGTVTYKLGSGPQGYTFGWGLEEGLFPVGSARFIQEIGLEGRMFNSDRFGGYLAYELTPERPIFHYNLPAVFGDLETQLRTPGAIDGSSFDYAILWRAEELQHVPPPAWAPVFREPGAVVLARRGSVNDKVIERYGISFFGPNLTLPQAKAIADRGAEATARLARELSDHLSFRRNPRMASLLGVFLTRQERVLEPRARLELLERAARHNGDHPDLLFGLGSANYQLGQLGEARQALERSLAVDPQGDTARVAHLTLSYVELDANRPQQAAARFETLVTADARDLDALFGLALSLQRAGAQERARERWQEYLHLAPQGHWRERAEHHLAELAR